MKAKDVKTGVVYAWRDGLDGKPTAAVVLETRWQYAEAGHAHLEAATERPVFQPMKDERHRGLRPSVGRYSEHRNGYLAVLWNGQDEPDLALLRSTTVAEAEALIKPAGQYGGGGHLRRLGEQRLVRVIDFRQLLGEWDDIVQDHADEQARREAVMADLRRESAERVEQTRARYSAIGALGVPGKMPRVDEYEHKHYGAVWEPSKFDRSKTGKVTLTLAQVDALLSLIPEGAKYVPPADVETEDDGWTYKQPGGAPSDPA